MKTFRQSLGILIACVLLFFLTKPFIQVHKQLEYITFQIQWRWFITSFGFMLLYRIIYVWPFTMLLRCISQGEHVPFRTAFMLFHLANITRYLPGRIWGVVRLLSLSHRFGLSRTTVGGSLTLHVGIETALGGLIAMSLFFSTHVRYTAQGVLEKISGHTVLLTLAVSGIMLAGLFCIPKGTTHARQFLKTFVPLLQNSRLWGNVLAIQSLIWMCQGLAFSLFVHSIVPVQWTHAASLTACYAFAWIVGFLSFLTPGGLGIREGLLGLLLANYMSTPQATLIALLCRVWMLAAEIVLAGVAFFLHQRPAERQKSLSQTFLKEKV